MSETRSTKWSGLELLLVFIAFLLLYLPFLSIDYDANGVIEAMNLESGARLSPNHILYGVLGRALYTVAHAAGYQGKSLLVIQILDAFCGALAVALACAAFGKLRASKRAALAAASLWGTSFIFWYYSTDVLYIAVAAAFTAAALYCSASLTERKSVLTALMLGVWISLATVTFQIMIFLVPLLLWPLRKRRAEVVGCLVILVILIGGPYIAVGVSQGHTNPVDFVRWTAGYAGNQLPEWGRFDASRIGIAASAGIRSFQWDAFEKLKDLTEHPTRIYAWRLSAGAICFGVLALLTLVLAIQPLLDGNSKFFWMVAGYALFLPFIVWFSPSESFWFLIPNLFLCAAVSLAWTPALNRPVGFAFIFGGVAVMATATFTSWVWNKHIDVGSAGRKVDCIARMVEPNDNLIATDWTWPAKLEYFHGIRSIQVIDLAAAFRNHDKLFESISTELEKTRQRNGRVFIIDPASDTPQHLSWLQEQTGFAVDDFARFPGRVRFQCEDSKFREVAIPR